MAYDWYKIEKKVKPMAINVRIRNVKQAEEG
jgi:hypothetical protein